MSVGVCEVGPAENRSLRFLAAGVGVSAPVAVDAMLVERR